MAQVSFVTKVGSTSDIRASKSDAVVIEEPGIGATRRTKGRLYLLCEASAPGGGAQIARELAELVRHEYYYDLSAGIEVSLRRALRQANRRATQRLREQRASYTLHIACAVVVNNEIYGSRIGGTQVFLVRRARLFLPGDEPGELADFVHRTTTREAVSLGSESDVLAKVWRQTVEPGDTLVIASSAVVDGLGAETLKNAAVTLHPRAAAEHVHNRAVADGVAGSDGVIFVEIAQASGAAARVAPEPEPVREPEEVVIAESIRSRIDTVWRHRPRVAALVQRVAAPVTSAATKGVAVGLELMPRRSAALPKHPDTARERSRRNRRAITTLAVMLLIAATGVGALAYRDYESTRAGREYQLAVVSAENDLNSAHNLAERKPPDPDGARQKIASAIGNINAASKSTFADQAQLAALRADAETLTDKLDGVIVDLGRIAAAAKPSQIIGNVNGLYITDPGTTYLWRIFGDPMQTNAILQRGTNGIGVPTLLTWQGEALYIIDDAHHVWRIQGTQVSDVTPPDAATWKSATTLAVFLSNLYVLDAASGQLWKHESADGVTFERAIPYLAQALPANTARSLAIDGDVWIVTATGEIQRYRRNPLETTAARVDFAPKWNGTTVNATAIQAVDAQRNIYVLDAPGRVIVQLSRDGRELGRVRLSPTLPPPTAFYVSEAGRVAYTVHGSKIVATSLDQ